MRRWWRALLMALLPCAALSTVRAADAVPVVVQSAPGQFDIAALDATTAHGVAAAAQEGWRLLAALLGLPEGFPTPIFVRVVPQPGEATGPFHVTVEPGGVVSLSLRAESLATPILQRALVQAMILRLAVAWHGVHERLAVPLWLEHGCVGWWRTRADLAQLDALKQATAGVEPPSLMPLVAWQRAAQEPSEWGNGAVWLLTWLLAESGRDGEWPALLHRLLGGEEPGAALNAAFPNRFATPEERELWWQTGWHHVRRTRTLPGLDATESRAQMTGIARFVFASPHDEGDVVVPLVDVLTRAREPIVAAELKRRENQLARLVPSLHPFYRNAGLSLAHALRDGVSASEPRRRALCAAYEEDWRDATELAAATSAALDIMERRGK